MIVEGVLSSVAALPTGLAKPAATEAADGAGFSDTLKRMMTTVEATNLRANEAVVGMSDGSVDVHDAMIALQRADMTLQLTMQIRNKLINAYQEIMRMPV